MSPKLPLSLAAIAIAGVFTVTLVAAPSGGDRSDPPRGADATHRNAQGPRDAKPGARLDRMMERLDLTDAQVAAIRAERDARTDEARALRDQIVDAHRKLRALHESMREAVAAHLTDEQKTALAARRAGKRGHGRKDAGHERPERAKSPRRSQRRGPAAPADGA